MWWEMFPVYEDYPIALPLSASPLESKCIYDIGPWSVESTEDYIASYQKDVGLKYFREKSYVVSQLSMRRFNKWVPQSVAVFAGWGLEGFWRRFEG